MNTNDDQHRFFLTAQLLYRAVQVADDLLAQSVGDSITSRQLSILYAVDTLDKPTQKQIVAVTGIDRSTVSDIAARLVKRGWLSRRRDPTDARRYGVKLTPAGKQILNEVLPVAKNVDCHVLAALTAKEQEQLIALLQKIAVSPPSKTVGKVRTDIA
ncbi:MAG: hypothetical protein B7Y80_19285 [Hyphomicrobium sp. 32-62-53]|nr:MAG: hypothetical protein B7Z29_17920 [Hyphomicrobium sp. 12-62-95]OYX97564.1 MAG: hypothetical protein B7Y80_19285 [Hyphomicrobium sp. 32-62-53]